MFNRQRTYSLIVNVTGIYCRHAHLPSYPSSVCKQIGRAVRTHESKHTHTEHNKAIRLRVFTLCLACVEANSGFFLSLCLNIARSTWRTLL